jgi:hypothetical protein
MTTASERRSSDPTGPPTTLVIASLLVAVAGIGGSALVAQWWLPGPVDRFDWFIFVLGAGQSIVAAAVLYAAATIVDELRKSRFLLTLSLTHASE